MTTPDDNPPDFNRQAPTSMPASTTRDALAWLDERLAQWDAAGLRRIATARAGPQGATVQIEGRELVNFGGNDYLSLAADRRVVGAAIAAAQTEGWGAGASPSILGRAASHARLEAALAEFEATEAAIVFSSGYVANVAAITSLVEAGDAIFSDQKNHASIIDGCRLSGAAIHVYSHADHRQLGDLLAQAREKGYRRRLIVTDTLFSMDGDLAPLPALVELADRFDCMLMVDEAHATGVFGTTGRGVCELQGVEHAIDVRVGTLSKAIGSSGGFICGRAPLVDWLRQRARGYVFSTAPPAPVAAAALAGLEIIHDEPQRRTELLERCVELRSSLKSQGWNLGASAGPILPIRVGDAGQAMALAGELRQRGLFVPAIRPPTVGPGESLLRASLCFGHTAEMIGRLTAALAELRT